ncbi:HXXEE domain-containing protein [Nonomuraea bangladeshensis]|uniref:HXXEE domain-containing protein n=1 Tax=Nonomuraea bangladeshensis TaxID=404385 RepID=UPI0031D022F2
MTEGDASPAVTAGVTWGLLAAWAVHDAEELVTMAGWLREARPWLEERFPDVPWERLEMSQAHVNVAIGLMGGIVAAAAARGAATGGRSPAFQTVLAGFGVHGVVHLAQSALVRGYTPGVATAPVVVIPYAWWAWRRLRAAGVPMDAGGRAGVAGLAALPLALGAVHGLAHLLTRARRPEEGGPLRRRPLRRRLP